MAYKAEIRERNKAEIRKAAHTVDTVIETLQALADETVNVVVRSCLEAEIFHLIGAKVDLVNGLRDYGVMSRRVLSRNYAREWSRRRRVIQKEQIGEHIKPQTASGPPRSGGEGTVRQE